MELAQSHRPEEAIPDSYDKCKPGFTLFTIKPHILYVCEFIKGKPWQFGG